MSPQPDSRPRQLSLHQSADNFTVPYLLFVSRRDINRNVIDLSYDKISDYSGISRKKIPDALTFLSVNGLIRSERQRSDINDFAVSNSYRLSFLESYRHGGTTGRAEIDAVRAQNEF